MKKIVFLALFIFITFLSNAQSNGFRSGLVFGFSPNQSILESAPINAGLATEFILPIVGVGAEVDLVYENKAFKYQTGTFSERFSNFKLPMYLKWKIGVPLFKGFLGAGATYSLSWKDLHIANARQSLARSCNSTKPQAPSRHRQKPLPIFYFRSRDRSP